MQASVSARKMWQEKTRTPYEVRENATFAEVVQLLDNLRTVPLGLEPRLKEPESLVLPITPRDKKLNHYIIRLNNESLQGKPSRERKPQSARNCHNQ